MGQFGGWSFFCRTLPVRHLSPPTPRPDSGAMLSRHAFLEIEGHAAAMLALARLPDDRAPSMDLLSLRLIKSKPKLVVMGREGDIYPAAGKWVLRVHKLAPKDRARWIVGHELAEWWLRDHRFASHTERESWCDALGAALVTPRAAFADATKQLGHRVHRLAEAFHVPQALALLRLGEVEDRPVALLRPSPLVRGRVYPWPVGPGLTKAVNRPPPGVHPVRIERRWGLMAR